VALVLDHLGAIYRQQKRLDEALEVFRQSLAIIEECDTRKRTPDGTCVRHLRAHPNHL
jgi:hypothetical protein